MAWLQTLKGDNPGEKIPLVGDTIILGRNPDCGIIVPGNAVSRQHARIVRSQNNYYIEDLKSRNKTFVNNQEVQPGFRQILKDNDRIKICDCLWTFHIDPASSGTGIVFDEDEDSANSPSTVTASVGRLSNQQLLEAQPTEKLHALLEVAATLSKSLQEDVLLNKVGDILFSVFRQADRCFIIKRETKENGDEVFLAKVTKTRRAGADMTARFSRTIVRKCLDSGQSLLFEDAQDSGKMAMSASIAEFRIRSVMCAPLIFQDGVPYGLIQLDSQDRNKTFSQDDLKLLIAVANQAVIALSNAELHEREKQLALIEKDLELARRVQQSFLPDRLPTVPGYEFYAFYQAAKNVGGDYYDFIPKDGYMGVLLGDVAGKGMPAALLMAKLSAEARGCMLLSQDPSKAINRLNDQLLQAGLMDRFVTLAACVVNPLTHTVTIINAGHISPLVYRQESGELVDCITRDLTGFPLGMMEGTEYDHVQVKLNPGDSIIVFTDGVTDALSADGVRFEETDGVRKAVNPGAMAVPEDYYTPKQIGKRIIDAVRSHAGAHPQNDDIALVCLGRRNGDDELELGPNPISSATGPITANFKKPLIP